MESHTGFLNLQYRAVFSALFLGDSVLVIYLSGCCRKAAIAVFPERGIFGHPAGSTSGGGSPSFLATVTLKKTG